MVNQAGLWLICGVRPAPGDPNSAETGPYGDGLYVLDFSGTGEFGISVDDWIAQIVQPRPVTQGDNILRYEYPPVTEVINLLLNSCTSLTYAALISKLARFQQLIADFWTGTGIHPVYLKWQAAGSPGPQYALARNLNYVDKTSAVLGVTSGALVLTIEREPFWRGVAPGENPKEWTLEQAGLTRGGTGYTYSDMALIGTSNDLVNGSVANRAERSSVTTYLFDNFIDIPADSIPGDAPPLVCLGFNETGGQSDSYYITHKAGAGTIKNRDGDIFPEYLDFAAGDGTVVASSDTSITNDAGGLLTVTYPATRKRAEVSFATLTAMSARIQWTASYAATMRLFANNTRGKFMVIGRVRQTGSANTIFMRLKYGNDAVGTAIVNETVGLPVAPGGGPANSWSMVYLGVITIPPDNKNGISSIDGRGLTAFGTASTLEYGDFSLTIEAERRSGAGVLYIGDIMLLPIGSGFIHITQGNLLDQTGYISRGKPGSYLGVNTSPQNLYSLSDFELVPGVVNRFYVLGYLVNYSASVINGGTDMSINIVPRWTGRRDV